jgi:hypothetical protein
VCLLAGAARAQDPTAGEAARTAYDNGTAAFKAGDFATAAREFARADALAPHPVALRWALTAATRAGDPVLGMTLVDRAGGRASDAELDQALDEARTAFAARVAGLTVRCPSTEPCQARVDESPVRPGERGWFLPGTHRVEVVAPRARTDRLVRLEPGASIEVVGDAPPPLGTPPPALPPPAPPETDDDGGISPAWFFVALGVTTGLGAATIWSGVDTLQKHDDYLAAPTQDAYDEGRAAQLRTNVLIGVTSATAVVTVLVGIFAVDWTGDDPPATALRGVTW